MGNFDDMYQFDAARIVIAPIRTGVEGAAASPADFFGGCIFGSFLATSAFFTGGLGKESTNTRQTKGLCIRSIARVRKEEFSRFRRAGRRLDDLQDLHQGRVPRKPKITSSFSGIPEIGEIRVRLRSTFAIETTGNV